MNTPKKRTLVALRADGQIFWASLSLEQGSREIVSCPDYFSPSGGREKYSLGTRLVERLWTVQIHNIYIQTATVQDSAVLLKLWQSHYHLTLYPWHDIYLIWAIDCLCVPAVSKSCSLSPEDGLSCIRNMAIPLPDMAVQKAFVEPEHGPPLLFNTIACC